jgi:tetratricopeptide (TPR) repeat protein
MVSLPSFRGPLRAGLLCILVCSVSAAQDKAAPQGDPAADRETIERLKAERDRALQANELITRAQAAMNAKKWAEAAEILEKLTAADPGQWEYHRSLGDALLNLGKYEDAIRTYDTGVSLVQKEPPAPAPGRTAEELNQAAARMLTNKGNAYIKLRRPDEAIAVFRLVAQTDPKPGLAWFNLAATCYNMGRMNDALEYCDKTIAADPAKADAYFIKGSVLMGNATMDSGGKMIFPSGMIESLQKYLELKPDGPHAADVKEMLKYAGVEPAPAKP